MLRFRDAIYDPHGKTLFPQASAIKIPILIEMFRWREEGRLRFEDLVTL